MSFIECRILTFTNTLDRDAILELLSVPDRLGHSFTHIQPLHPLNLDMYPGQARKIGNLPEAKRAAPSCIISVFTEKGGELPLPVRSFALG